MKILQGVLPALCLAGCVAASTDGTPVPNASDPLMLAFSSRIETLEDRSRANDQTAQIALAIVKAEGLRGVAPDPAGAADLRRRALAAGAPTQITQYIPGINGAPGRTALIILPGHGFSATALRRIDGCVTVLKARSTDTAAFYPDFELYNDDKALAAHEAAQAQAAETCGGDERYGTLSLLWDRARPWGGRILPDCDHQDRRCRALSDKIARLNARDPAAEAHAAVSRGDARLGAFNSIGPMPQGWSQPGVDCKRWTREMVGKWHVNQDVVLPGDREHTSASVAFIAAYNRAVVTDPAFPWPDVCAETLVAPLDHYPGPVRRWTEAARSGDPARLAEVPAGQDVNAPDTLGMTALDWAMRRRDEAMATALLDAGADPTRFNADTPSPLALALSQSRVALARRLIDRGARMIGDPGVCDYGGPWGGGPDRTKNNGCSWAGMMIQAGAFDLLDAQAAAGGLDPAPVREIFFAPVSAPRDTVVSIDPINELHAAFVAAVAAGDAPVIDRLLPHVGHSSDAADLDAPWSVLEPLITGGRQELALRYAGGRGANAARSDAEAGLWRAAAEGGQFQALLFLADYGAELNLLPADRLSVCAVAARGGDAEGLLACVNEAGAIRTRLQAAIRAGDLATVRPIVEAASDLNERGKVSQLSVAVRSGTAPMVQAMLRRGARPIDVYPSRRTSLYHGALKARADAALAAVAPAAEDTSGTSLVLVAAGRGDAAMLHALAEAGARNLVAALQTAGNLGNPPPGLPDSLFQRDRSVDNENLPNRAVDRDFRAFTLLAAEAARAYGPQSLETPFASAVYSGYNDAAEALIAAGFDLSKARNPAKIWANWSTLGTPCKPSTGRILIRERLSGVYPADDFTHWPPLHAVAAGCVDARGAELLVREGGMAVNQIDVDGQTPLDLARVYRRQPTVAVLERLGGLGASQAAPADHAARQARLAIEEDLDLFQGENDPEVPAAVDDAR
ncbi:MAG: ankyrin repeat domain-containing protein [Caulobacteraceae bacterium]|nr:ankyrin repeat domain-containing protein [Caulobacteraceae bacterium]